MAGPELTPTRRAVLLGALALGGCAALAPAELPAPVPAGRAPVPAASLQIVIFEMRDLSLPFHTGLIIRTPEEVAIYDPSGTWDMRGRCTREGEMIRHTTPAQIESYLRHDGLRYAPGGWVVHLFERAVPPDLARLALARAAQAAPTPILHCTYGVTSLLSGLPGFDFIEPQRVTGALLRSLVLRDDFTYTRRDAEAVQPG